MSTFLLTHGSYLTITLVLLLTGVGLPIPEEVPIIAAGLLAGHGQLDPWLALAACMAGVLGGDCLLYAIGRHFGANLIRTHRYWARLVSPDREVKMEALIQRHGLKVFFFARFLVGLRSPVYITAGILRMPFRRFLPADLASTTMVITTFFLLSMRFGPRVVAWIRQTEIWISASITLLLAVIVAGFYLCRYRLRKAGRPAAEPPTESGSNGASQ